MGNSNRKKLNIFISYILFTCIFAGALLGVNSILKDKNTYCKYEEFHKEVKQFDVLLFGSSHMELSISPMELWKEYGIISYNFGNPAEDLNITYWLMKNAIEVNKPKAIVMDLGMFGMWDLASNDSVHFALDTFPISKTKYEAVNTLMGDDNDAKIEMFFPLGAYHTRWKSLSKDDFKNTQYYVKGSMSYGYPWVSKIVPMEQFPKQFDEISPDYADFSGDVDCLNNIIDLCENNDIKLLFTVYPYKSYEVRQQIINMAERIGNERGVPCINFLKSDSMIDYDVDFYDESHVNMRGMHKMTLLTGAYLMNNFGLVDHRDDSSYEDWNESYEEYCNLKYESILSQDDLNITLLEANDNELDVKIYYKDGCIDESVNEKLYMNINRINNPEEIYSEVNTDENDIILLVSDKETKELKIVKTFKKTEAGYISENVYNSFPLKYLFNN